MQWTSLSMNRFAVWKITFPDKFLLSYKSSELDQGAQSYSGSVKYFFSEELCNRIPQVLHKRMLVIKTKSAQM